MFHLAAAGSKAPLTSDVRPNNMRARIDTPDSGHPGASCSNHMLVLHVCVVARSELGFWEIKCTTRPVFDVMEATPDPRGADRRIAGGSSLLTDGYWVWRQDLAAYVEHFGVALPERSSDTRGLALLSRWRSMMDWCGRCYLLQVGRDMARAAVLGQLQTFAKGGFRAARFDEMLE